MPTLATLLAAPGIEGLLHVLCGPGDAAHVHGAALVEDAAELGEAPEGSIAVLTRRASRDAEGYRLDMAVRVAGSRGIAALVLTDDRSDVAPTVRTLVDRSRLTVLSCRDDIGLSRLVGALERELAGDAERALARIEAALARLDERAAERSSDLSTLLAELGLATGTTFRYAPRGESAPEAGDDLATPVLVEDELEGTIHSPAAEGHAATARRVAAELAAAVAARSIAAVRRAEDVPARSRGELLTQLLLASPDRAERMLAQLRQADLGIDGWNAVVRIELENLDELTGDEIAAYQLGQRVGRLALDTAREADGTWHRAHLGSAILLVRITRHDPGVRSGRELSAAAADAVARAVAGVRELVLVCGVGGTHAGAAGLRASAAEAHAAAAAARATHRVNAPLSYDEVGLHRTLMEWYASDAAREAVDALLEPIDRMGGQRARVALMTLQAYLDNQGSLSRTASELHLHRNAVAYRIKRVFEVLDVDPEDADARLLLQLACRARSLG